MITELTKYQEEMIPVYRKKWLDIGLSTEEKMNEEKAKEAISLAYKCAKIKPPEEFVFLDSPYAAYKRINEDNGTTKNSNILSQCIYGSHEAYWLSFYEYFWKECNIDLSILEGIIETSKYCGWWWPYENICYVSAKPREIHFDDKENLHNSSGPAISYPDGWSIYSYHGIQVDRYIIMEPEKITINDINDESNAEIRRIKLDQYGWEKYIIDSDAKMIHKDTFGELYRKDIPGDEPLVMVKVWNSTKEEDGTIKNYFLRVPPNITTAHEAVSWTFGMDTRDYVPIQET